MTSPIDHFFLSMVLISSQLQHKRNSKIMSCLQCLIYLCCPQNIGLQLTPIFWFDCKVLVYTWHPSVILTVPPFTLENISVCMINCIIILPISKVKYCWAKKWPIQSEWIWDADPCQPCLKKFQIFQRMNSLLLVIKMAK